MASGRRGVSKEALDLKQRYRFQKVCSLEEKFQSHFKTSNNSKKPKAYRKNNTQTLTKLYAIKVPIESISTSSSKFRKVASRAFSYFRKRKLSFEKFEKRKMKYLPAKNPLNKQAM